MDNNSKVISSCNDSISGVTKCHDGNTSAEEISLLQHLQKGISETAEEQNALTREVAGLLSKLNLEVKMLPSDIQENLEKMSMILRAEKLLEFDEMALSVARARKIIEEKRQQREDRQMSLIFNRLVKNYTNLQTKFDHLQNELSSVEKIFDVIEREKDDLDRNKTFLLSRLTEYRQTAEKLEADLSAMQVDELYPDKILNKYELYLEKRGELVDLNQTLTQYSDLPPNLLQAKQLLESKRKEYENLEQLFLDKSH